MTTDDDYTDPTKWMEFQVFPETDISAWEPYIEREYPRTPLLPWWKTTVAEPFTRCQHEQIIISPKLQSPGESGFDLED